LTSIVFSWSGFPDYAARCIRAVIDRHPEEVSVIGTRPDVPIEGMERSLGQPVHWIDGTVRYLKWADLGLQPPDLFFQGGYYLPAFRSLGAECRGQGGKVVCLSDATWRGHWRQILVDPLRHRALLRRRFDGVLVPGKSGLRHARIMGYAPEKTLPGLLGADPILFCGGRPLHERPKTILFVGRLEPVKNVMGLITAFQHFAQNHPDWVLRICGRGPQRADIPGHPGIHVEEFVQPSELAEIMRGARCLVVPSLREPWGLVVHEAALSGCALALSSSVGAAQDLAQPQNAILFAPGRVEAIEAALRKIAEWDAARWQRAEGVSRERARQFGPDKFADAVDRFIAMFGILGDLDPPPLRPTPERHPAPDKAQKFGVTT
jgi:glycosyltransferase involved in cell wall biosynthesis